MEAIGPQAIFAICPLIFFTIMTIYFQRQPIKAFYIKVKQFIFGREIREVPVNAGPVYVQGDCSICLAEKRFQISGTCGHTFCAECILSIYERTHEKVGCPLCRKPISTIFKVFHERIGDNPQQVAIIQRNIKKYNERYDDNRSLVRRIMQFPYVLRRAPRHMRSVAFWLLFLRSLHFFRVVGLAILYLLMPFDLIPESLFGIIGFLDDIFIFLFLILLGIVLFMPIFIRYLGR